MGNQKLQQVRRDLSFPQPLDPSLWSFWLQDSALSGSVVWPPKLIVGSRPKDTSGVTKHVHWQPLQKRGLWEFPGGLLVKIPGFHYHGPGSIPGWGTSHKPHDVAKRKWGGGGVCEVLLARTSKDRDYWYWNRGMEREGREMSVGKKEWKAFVDMSIKRFKQLRNVRSLIFSWV